MDLTLGIQVTSGGLMVAKKGREKSSELFVEQQLTQCVKREAFVWLVSKSEPAQG